LWFIWLTVGAAVDGTGVEFGVWLCGCAPLEYAAAAAAAKAASRTAAYLLEGINGSSSSKAQVNRVVDA
jgi:hypothetical protein